jgi:hypothetical protein
MVRGQFFALGPQQMPEASRLLALIAAERRNDYPANPVGGRAISVECGAPITASAANPGFTGRPRL